MSLEGVKVRPDSVVEKVTVPCDVDGDAELEVMYEVRLDGELVHGIADAEEASADEMVMVLREAIKRAKVIHGLREMADHLEQHPEIAVWFVGAHGPDLHGEDDIAHRAVEVARELGGRARVDGPRGKLIIRRDFGPNVHFEQEFDVADISTPEIVDGKVVWNLPQELQALVDGTVYDHFAGETMSAAKARVRYADAEPAVLVFLAGGAPEEVHYSDAKGDVWLTRRPGAPEVQA